MPNQTIKEIENRFFSHFAITTRFNTKEPMCAEENRRDLESLKVLFSSSIRTVLDSVSEQIEGEKRFTDCQPNEEDPPALHEFKEPSDWRSECLRCGEEKKDTEDTGFNFGFSTAQSIINQYKEGI